jgi:hypothetical protein
MPISTSGLSVPQLGQTIDPSIYGNQSYKPMTIGDMLDISGKSLDVQKKKALLPSEIEVGQAAAKKATAEANTAQLQNYQAHLTNVIQDQQRLISKDDLTAQDIIDSVKTHAQNAGTPDNVVQQTLAGLPAGGNTAQLKAWLASNMARSLTAQGQLEALYPKASQVNVGGQTVTVGQGNPLLAAEQPGVPTGPYIQNTLAPTVAQGPTGGPMAFGGGGVPQAGNLNNRPVQVQTAVPAAGQDMTAQNAPQPTTKTGVTPEQMSKKKEASGPIPYQQGETYDAYRNRVGKVQESVGTAKNDIDTANPNSVTNAKYTNEQILKALDDKNVRVGPLMQAIAEKSEGLNLTPDEQYVKKLLEQRIQQQQSRSNADQTSKSIASGNFGNSKDTIRNVLFKDMGNLTAQELQARGTLNRAGNPNKPNLAGVNQFQNEFAKSADPDVTHLMGIIGSKPLNKLTPAEVNHLQKEFAGKSKEEIDSLMKKRQAIIDLVGK